ncbi:hypothetical protein Z946_653 [Sulfitobacter noctilucicola]|nr:hypothetical protein Z946_653 [Sulfitobacter noctilucicola]
MKFSEVPPYPYTCRSLHRVLTGKMRDFSDLAVSATDDCFSYAAAAAKRTKG